MLCGFLGAIAWGALATFVDSKYTAVLAIFLSSMSVAFSDVVSNSSLEQFDFSVSNGNVRAISCCFRYTCSQLLKDSADWFNRVV